MSHNKNGFFADTLAKTSFTKATVSFTDLDLR